MRSTLSWAGSEQSKRAASAKGDPIADLRSPSGSLISVYVDRPAPGGFAALLTELLKPIREQADSMGRSVAKAVRSDADRIHDLAVRLEVDPAPSFAIFASDLDDVFMLESLTHPVQSVSRMGPRPYLRPLRAAPRGLRSGVIVADRALARTFIGFEGVVEELGSPLSADIGKSNYGGFGGYEEQGVRAHADEASARLWKDASWRLLEEHRIRAFDYFAIGGHEEAVEEMARSLHPYLARLPRAVFVANPHKVTVSGLRSELAGQDLIIRRHRQESLAGRVCDTAWSDGNAVLGLNATIEAANSQAIDTLVVAGPFARSGTVCSDCGQLARNGRECSVCGAETFAVEDVVACAMEATIAAGGSVYQIKVASALDVEGVGALTRFPVSS
ncbi:MAG: hypothetical protein U9N56_08265 [Actinomycetota bacterium]|nr:hypothetical protein [Actinomycetota bacterium]